MIITLTPFGQVILESALKHRPFAELMSLPQTRRQIRDNYRSVMEKVKAARKEAEVAEVVEP